MIGLVAIYATSQTAYHREDNIWKLYKRQLFWLKTCFSLNYKNTFSDKTTDNYNQKYKNHKKILGMSVYRNLFIFPPISHILVTDRVSNFIPQMQALRPWTNNAQLTERLSVPNHEKPPSYWPEFRNYNQTVCLPFVQI